MIHQMIVEQETADEALYACEQCSRRLVVGKRVPKSVVIDEGAQVPHLGGTGGVVMSLPDGW